MNDKHERYLSFLIAVLITLLLLAVFIPPSKANAVEVRVRVACTGDYFSLCSHTSPGSPECKDCFRRNGPNLSRVCRRALRASSEFGGEYKARRRSYVVGN